MAHNYSPADLQNSQEFELIDVVDYDELKKFILKKIKKPSSLLLIYSILQLIFIVFAAGLLVVLILGFFSTHSIWYYLGGILFSFSFLILLHELLHALAFLLLGKSDIGFGMQLKRFVFYAEANMQVVNAKQMRIVGLFPLVVVAILCIVGAIISVGSNWLFFFIAVFLIHFLFCAGDIAIISYFGQHNNLYSYDNRSERRTYYFAKKTNSEKAYNTDI